MIKKGENMSKDFIFTFFSAIILFAAYIFKYINNFYTQEDFQMKIVCVLILCVSLLIVKLIFELSKAICKRDRMRKNSILILKVSIIFDILSVVIVQNILFSVISIVILFLSIRLIFSLKRNELDQKKMNSIVKLIVLAFEFIFYLLFIQNIICI